MNTESKMNEVMALLTKGISIAYTRVAEAKSQVTSLEGIIREAQRDLGRARENVVRAEADSAAMMADFANVHAMVKVACEALMAAERASAAGAARAPGWPFNLDKMGADELHAFAHETEGEHDALNRYATERAELILAEAEGDEVAAAIHRSKLNEIFREIPAEDRWS